MPCPPPGDLPYPGIKFASPELAGRFFITEPPARRNINNLRYVDDTTLMAESEEELKSLLKTVKEERERAGSKLNIQKTKIDGI